MNRFYKKILEIAPSPSVLVIIVLGIVFRFRAFLVGRSLWVDEAMLALNIINRSFLGLFKQPMEYGQSSPIGYVVSVKAFTMILGDSEYALRLYSLLAGCLALILIGVVSEKVLGNMGAFAVTVLFAFNPNLIYYSSEIKQYISDVLAVMVMLWLFQKNLALQTKQRDFILLGILGALTPWFSHPVVFVIAGIGLVLFIHFLKNGDRGRLLTLLGYGVSWGVSLIILYFIHFRYLASSDLLIDYWEGGFMPLPPWSEPVWLLHTWQSFLQYPVETSANAFFVFLVFAIGLIYIFRKYWQIGSVIFITLGLALFASGLRQYPLVGRLLLFAIPLFVLGVGAGIDWLGKKTPNQKLSYIVQISALVYIVWMPISGSLEAFISPKYFEHMKPHLEYLSDFKRDSDLLYVYYNAGPAFRFYAPKFKLDSMEYIIGSDHSNNPEAYQDEIDQLSDSKRVWFLFSHVYEDDKNNDKDFIIDYANHIGKKIREFRVPQTSVFLYYYEFE